MDLLMSWILWLEFTLVWVMLPLGPRPYLVIRNLLEMGGKPHKSLANPAKIHGPIMSLRLG
ncbi:hypothetical protein CUMW_281530 [Citrus unshiu]|nr:hypothetical protein CUMW_281530 [Citrus unshiu]